MSRHSGWHRALDTQLDTHKWCVSEKGRDYNMGFVYSLLFVEPEVRAGSPDWADTWPNVDQAERCRDLCDHLNITLWRGDTIFVTSDMLHVIMQAAEDMPEDVTIDVQQFMSNYGFCLFEEAVTGTDVHGEVITISAMAWEVAPLKVTNVEDDPEKLSMGMVLYFFTDCNDHRDKYNESFNKVMRETGAGVPPLALVHFWPGRDGDPLPQITTPGTELIAQCVKLFVAMQMISRQTIGEPIQMRPERATRKRFAREYPNEPERMITLITLRRKTVKHNDDPVKVEWSRRWIVRGHWRKQYYPKSKTYDWKYIYEYVKGPEDKPLITGRRVFDFRR